MRNRDIWPETDQAWVTRYRASMAGKHVPAIALDERERELLNAVREADLPAAHLFGDAPTLAAEDVLELATTAEAVRTSEGGGPHHAVRDAGGTLLGMGVVSVLLLALRSGWSADLNIAHLLVAVSVAVPFMGWIAARAFFSAGRSVAMTGVLVTAGVIALAGIASAVALGNDHIVARAVPVPILGLALIAPGIVILVRASRMQRQVLRTSWDDSDWLRRLRGGLRARFVPADIARGHVSEIQQSLAVSDKLAYEEYGHPLVLARDIADADRTSRLRLWWLWILAGTGSPLVGTALVVTAQSWGNLTIPIASLLLLSSIVTPLVGWSRRPWVQQR
ncbi:hypothetical protein E3T35_06610 [Cryobacterium sp. TMT1-2-2]|uniref:hypothetical protein n=1 Tax=Cryobacterium sp. TMT1-2-2 TaxID=1259233 RepID=UPI00106B4B07|nr:hypothetical protein [Cryobacterium sp. TMT1-2-2]TFD12946.1 hypothetical protein E3T35_06610 [Cryobacterium sp. TMT1-2-2]